MNDCWRLTAAWLAAGLLIPGAGGAQPATSTPPSTGSERIVYQDTVVVRSTRLLSRLSDFPATGTVLSPEQVRYVTAATLSDVVRQVPGLNVYDLSGTEAGGQVESRGFTSLGFTSHLRVLIDEMPVNDLEGDRVDWNLLDLAQVERVEILRGPTSFLYGNAAMSGVVNLVTRGVSAKTRPWVQVGSGSGGLAGGAGGFSFGMARAQGSLSGAYQRTDGLRDHAAAETWSGYGQVRARLAHGWTGRARLFAHRGIRDIPGPLPAPDWRTRPGRSGTPEDFRDHLALQGAVELVSPAAERLDGIVVLATDTRKLDARETVVPVGALDRASDAHSWRGEARLHWRPPILPIASVLIGGEIERGRLESRYYERGQPPPASPVGAGDVVRTSGGVFALARTSHERSWMLMAGGRLDWLHSSMDDPTDAAPRPNADRLSAWSPTLGLNLKLPRAGNAYLHYAGSFKAPTLEQLYDRRPYILDLDGPGPTPPFVLHLSSRVLQPQHGWHVESGARSPLWNGGWADVAAYYSRSKDEIGFDLAGFRYANIDRSIHYGIEAQLSSDFPAGVAGRFSYTLTRARFDGGPDDGRQVNGVPEHLLSVRFTLRHPRGGSLMAEGRYVSTQWLDEGNAYEVPPYGVLDLGLAQPIGGIELLLSVRNVTDRRFAETGYLTRDAFGADLPLYFPGAGRIVRAGLRLPAPRPADRPARD